MIIKFDELEETQLKAFYGGNDTLRAQMFKDEKNKILRGVLVPSASIGRHRHETSAEIIFALSGTGKVFCDGKEDFLTSGNCHYCPKGSEHSLACVGDEPFVFYAVVPEQ